MTRETVKCPKFIRGSGTGITILLLSAPFLMVVAAIVLSNPPSMIEDMGIKQSLAKALAYSSFLIVTATFFLSLALLLLKKIPKKAGITGVVVSILYCLLPLNLAMASVEKKLELTINAQNQSLANLGGNKNSPLSSLLSLRPHYQMGTQEIENFFVASNTLILGEYYTISMRKMPPVPEDSPLIMRKLQDNGIALTYYIMKKWKGTRYSPNDKYITLLFDSEENLVDIKRAL